MRLTTSQLQSRHKALVDALKHGETVEITYHGRVLGVVYPVSSATDSKTQEQAMSRFFGMHGDKAIENIEKELHAVRPNRRSLHDL